MSIIGSNILAGASGQASGTVYDINNSLRFRSSASAYLSRTMSASSTTFTVSCWVKRGILGTGFQYIFSSGTDTGAGNIGLAYNDITDTIYVFNGSTQVASTAVYRDPASWYHVVMSVSSGTATVYVNNVNVGITQTSIALGTYGNIGRYNTTYPNHFDGYLADFHLIDGSALTPSSFGSTSATTGSWIPKAYSGSYGTKGFYLKFSDIATTSGSNVGLGKDFSGNANYFNTNSISVTAGVTYDAMTDVPTNTSATVANYATWNPLDALTASTFQNGNLQITTPSAGGGVSRATMGLTGNKFYWEVVGTTNGNYLEVGILKSTDTSASYLESQAGGYSYLNNGQKVNNGTATSYGNSYTTNDVIGVAFDATTGSLYFSKNGTWQNSGDPAAGTGYAYTGLTADTYMPAISDSANTISTVASINFGQRPFTYTAPSGFVALNTYNLPTPTILQGNKYMDATLYTGTGASLAITNAGAFKPDMVWIGPRSTGNDKGITDSVRGVTKQLYTDLSNTEYTDSTFITSLNSNGFTAGTSGGLNASAVTYVGWQWQANQGSTVSNTSGSITSTTSVSTTAGFSIVTYTGTGANATVGHGLGVAPSMVIIKQRSNAGIDWVVWHTTFSSTQYMTLNTTAAVGTAAALWNSTRPSSTVISIGTDVGTNQNTITYVAYCWAEIAGFSKFGSYTGNNSADGPFVYLGFRPKFIMFKDSSQVGVWSIMDSARETYNVQSIALAPNNSLAESTYTGYAQIDFLSNGFKIRANNANQYWNNVSSNTVIYMAFAENPTKFSNAR